MGLSGKQVIHPSHIHPCKVAFTPSPTEIRTRIKPYEHWVMAGIIAAVALFILYLWWKHRRRSSARPGRRRPRSGAFPARPRRAAQAS